MIKKIVQKMDLLAQKEPLGGTRTNNTRSVSTFISNLHFGVSDAMYNT